MVWEIERKETFWWNLTIAENHGVSCAPWSSRGSVAANCVIGLFQNTFLDSKKMDCRVWVFQNLISLMDSILSLLWQIKNILGILSHCAWLKTSAPRCLWRSWGNFDEHSNGPVQIFCPALLFTTWAKLQKPLTQLPHFVTLAYASVALCALGGTASHFYPAAKLSYSLKRKKICPYTEQPFVK